ncbi:PHP domain-containing protein [Candidatus Chlorohelix sp.]|uniref:PHP domain-containing protein n=1 Tax=Candidatus Chlorohelix sp. TaxID=3139201 RepID=UPI0030712545
MKAPIFQINRGVDLHTHTFASDGVWSPRSLVEAAVAKKIGILSVCDHETLSSLKMVGIYAKKNGIQFIPGVEIAIEHKGSVYHLLMYGFDPENAEINALLEETRLKHWHKKQIMRERLEMRGYKIAESPLDAITESISPIYELACSLENDELNFNQAWAICREVEPKYKIAQPAKKVLDIARNAGAITILAHPGRGGAEIAYASNRIILELVKLGLEGVEAYYHAHDTSEEERLVELATRHKLLVTCGSDSHDTKRKPIAWNPALCNQFLERLNIKPFSAAA